MKVLVVFAHPIADSFNSAIHQTVIEELKKAGHTDWTSPDGTIKYEMSGTDLVVRLNGTQVMTVNENFQSGQFGVRLLDCFGQGDARRAM